MKKKKPLYVGLFVLVLTAFAAWFLLRNGDDVEIEYRFDTVRRGDISKTVTATGSLEAVTTVQVGSQVSGTISRLYADYNTVVHSGDIVAQIDPTFLEAQLKESEANLERLKASETDARRNLDRIRELFRKAVTSQAELDAAITAYDVAKAGRKQSEASMDRAQVNLRYATIKAPIDGVVISRNVDVGQTVAASLSAPTLFVIANDLSKMQVKASIDEADIGMVGVSQRVSFTVDAYPDERFSGRVSEIRLEPINTQNVISYDVIIDVPNPDLKLMPGMTANVSILIAQKENVLRVPAIALRFTPPESAEIEQRPEIEENPEVEEGAGTYEGSSESPPSDAAEEKRSTSQSSTTPRQAETRSKQNARVTPSSSAANGPNAKSGPGGENPFAGLSREERRAKFQSMSPEERKALRAKFMGGQRKSPGWQPGQGESFQGFDRNRMLDQRGRGQQDKPAVMLTEKWTRTGTTRKNRVTPGRLWIRHENGKLRSVQVKTGLSDGSFTEIMSDQLTEGDQIVITAIVRGGSSQQQNPFNQRRRRY